MTDTSTRPLDSLQMMAYIISRCIALKVSGINITKLQKLMYCCYGTALGACNFRICDESPEAWQYGPVFPRTLRSIKTLGIGGFAKQMHEKFPETEESLPENVKTIIDQTLEVFGKFAANQLSNWSHIPGSPWSRASRNGTMLYGQIDDATIADYFRQYVLKPKSAK